MRTWPVALGLPAILAIVWTVIQNWLQTGEPTTAHEYTVLALGVLFLAMAATLTLQRRQEVRSTIDLRRSESRPRKT